MFVGDKLSTMLEAASNFSNTMSVVYREIVPKLCEDNMTSYVDCYNKGLYSSNDTLERLFSLCVIQDLKKLTMLPQFCSRINHFVANNFTCVASNQKFNPGSMCLNDYLSSAEVIGEDLEHGRSTYTNATCTLCMSFKKFLNCLNSHIQNCSSDLGLAQTSLTDSFFTFNDIKWNCSATVTNLSSYATVLSTPTSLADSWVMVNSSIDMMTSTQESIMISLTEDYLDIMSSQVTYNVSSFDIGVSTSFPTTVNTAPTESTIISLGAMDMTSIYDSQSIEPTASSTLSSMTSAADLAIQSSWVTSLSTPQSMTSGLQSSESTTSSYLLATALDVSQTPPLAESTILSIMTNENSSSIMSTETTNLLTSISASSSIMSTTSIMTTTTTQTTTTDTTPTTTTTTTPTISVRTSDGRAAFIMPDSNSLGSFTHNFDEMSQQIQLQKGFPLCGIVYNDLYLNPNGFVSFGRRFQSWWPRRMNRLSTPLVGFYWYDMDAYPWFGNTGQIFYHIYDADNSAHVSKLSEITQLVKLRYNNANFNAKWALVATWYNVSPYPLWWYFNQFQKTTFQAILVTDHTSASYAIGNYNSNNYFRRRASIGYKCETQSKTLYYRQNRGNKLHNYYQRNINYKGLYIHRISHGAVLTREQLCLDSLKDINEPNLNGEEERFRCPCSSRFTRGMRRNWNNRFNRWWIRCFFTRGRRRTHGDTMECCYNIWGSLITSGKYSGFYHTAIRRWRFYRKYMIENVKPWRQCCDSSTKHCDKFHTKRPRNILQCRDDWRMRRSRMFGDPHFKSLDGNTFTFNGWGEYTLAKGTANGESVVVQARTTRGLDTNGTAVNATIFSGFCGTADSGDKFEVQLNVDSDRSKMFIYANGQDITTAFYNDANYSSSDFGNMDISRENDTLSITLESGVQFTFDVTSKTLAMGTAFPGTFNASLSGLLGNFDGDISNDYKLPNGTVLPFKNYTEREIYYNFGQHWAVSEAESCFNYTKTPGKGHSYYNHQDFTPLFLEDYPQADRDKATQVCGSDDNVCIVDYLATNDATLASSSSDTSSSSNSENAALANESPQISGPSSAIFNNGQITVLQFSGSDDSGSFTFKLVDSPSTGVVTLNSNTGAFQWTAAGNTSETISIATIDDKGAESPPIEVKIFYCSLCNGHGTCAENTTINGDTSSSFNHLQCNCDSGWEGDNCENDFDGCSLQACADGTNCTDLTPAQQQALNVSYNCSDCPTGYELSDNKCIDIDECNVTTTCPQQCTNTEGSYTCSCYDGYRYVTSVCTDIDECGEKTAGCEQECNNIAGNFTCSCVTGYTLNSDGKTCTQTTDVCSALNCAYTCKNGSNGQLECICRSGYQLASDGTNCTDVNECNGNICSQGCSNSQGSFTCSCYAGYQLKSDKISCEECPDETYGLGCANSCDICDEEGTDRCDKVTGCVCNSFYTGYNCSDDVDECQETPTICGSNKKCNNIEDGYECDCISGFEQDGSNCVDINECDDISTHNCSNVETTCQNNAGGFTCSCNTGYRQLNSFECEDINECSSQSHGCDQICTNNDGSYNCECNNGFRLDDDRKTCVKESDPCQSQKNCSYSCVIDNGSPTCICKSGYNLASDGETCLDVNECLDTTLNICSQKDFCINNDGSFTCSCSVGYKLDNDNRTCTACSGNTYGENCASTCSCTGLGANNCNHISGCVCNTGWAGSSCENEIDECQAATSPCTGANQECQNTIGSYECRCKQGFKDNSGTCQNIDECSDDSDGCGHTCTDTVGSFVCTCPVGMTLAADQKACEDIDECKSSQLSNCAQVCTNNPGSFICSCYDGYQLNETTRSTCYAKTACSSSHVCQQNCVVNSTGHEVCSCNTGYNLNADDISCDDINECATNTPCSDGCNNTQGGYACTCDVGQMLNDDKVTCKDCPDNTYGMDCTNNCTCVNDNTESCIKTNGTCICKTGWTGTNCETDIDECTAGTDGCSAHSMCKNTNGSYACQCDAGYTSISRTECSACSNSKWGVDCAHTCTCVTTNDNTILCNKTNGFCHCKSTWNGTDCSEDVNECIVNPNICTGGKECSNLPGSHKCECPTGYAVNSSGICADIDECFSRTDNCHAQASCNNTQGGFTCTCNSGYRGDGVTCDIFVSGDSGAMTAMKTSVVDLVVILSFGLIFLKLHLMMTTNFITT